MSNSFRYPPLLLHSITEPQWFPRPAKERESSLDALERQEEARREALRAAVLQEAPEPIGVAGGSDKVKHEVAPLLNNSSNAADTVDVMGTSTAVSFWHKYQQEFREWQRDTAISELEDSMIAEPTPRDEQQLPKGARLSSGSSMSMNSSRSPSPLLGDSPAPVYQRW